MSQSQLVRIFILLTLSLVACDPGQPVAVSPMDAGVDVDMQPVQQDQAVPDLGVDLAVEVDALTVDASLPDYVEDLEPNIPPESMKVTVTGDGDLFRLYWWRGGRMWQRAFTANFEAALGDEERIETVVDHAAPTFLRFIPPYTEPTRVLRPTTWPNDEAGYLVMFQDDAWQSYHLSSSDQSALLFTSDALKFADHNFGPTAPSSAIIAGVVDGRVQTVQPTLPAVLKPVGERDAPLPVDIAPMGHLWLLGYSDGHCASFTSAEGMGDEVGNWRCFADSDTHILGRASLASDDQGPAMVSHRAHTLHVWDPRPGLVTNPWLINPTFEMSQEGMVSTALPEGWGMHEALGHQVLDLGDYTVTFHGRQAQTLVYIATSEETTYWVLVSRSRIVVVEKLPAAISALLVLNTEPVHLLWDGVEGRLNAVPLSLYAQEPLLSTAPNACASRSPESCGLADADCDGDAEGGICCPFVYAHSDVSTLSETGAFEGPWFVSKSDLGALLAVHRAGRIELMHATNQSDQCFACVSGVGPIALFTHTDAVVAVVSSSADGGVDCPSACSVINVVQTETPLDGSDEDPETDEDVAGVDENSGGSAGEPPTPDDETEAVTSSVSDLLIVHPTPGQLVVQPLECEAHLLESAGTDDGVRILAFCLDRALEYQVLEGVLSETPLTIDIGVEPAVWVGPQTKRIIGGRYVAQWLTAHGDDLTLKAWSFGVDGLIEDVVPEVLSTLPVEGRLLPIRRPITEIGLITRISQDHQRLELLSGHQWVNIPSHLWVQSIQFSKYEDFALTVAALRDPTQPGFDPIEQTLAVYGHDLGGIDSPWGQYLELESSAILGYSFQGAILPEWSHYSLEPNVWWSVGRDNVSPTVKRLGLSCEPTTRLEAQKSE
jgi:hypothetical protein